MRSALVLVLTGFSLILAAPLPGDSAAKLHPALVKRAGTEAGVIIRFATALDARMHAAVRRQGGTLVRDLAIINSAAYRVPVAALPKLAALPQVQRISPDEVVRPTMDVTAASVGATTAWSTFGATGKNIGVVVIDSGVGYHADLNNSSGQSRVVYNGYFRTDTTTDDLAGHGTHVAGIIAGRGTNSTGSSYSRTFKGIAPDAKIVNIAVLDRYSNGKDSNVIAAISQAVLLKSTQPSLNIRVINLSVGRPVSQSYKTDPLCLAVEAAWKAGIVVVVAAGNEGRNNTKGTQGYGTILAPGNDPYVITVGAMKTKGTASRSDDGIASYSSKGPTAVDHVVKPDLVAPGNQMVALLAGGGRMRNSYPGNKVLIQYFTKNVTATNQGSDNYYWMSGTSMATPVVSGAVALMLEKEPSLTPDEVKARLMKTAFKALPLHSTTTVSGTTYVGNHDMFTVGAGYLDIAAALSNHDQSSNSARSPIAVYNASTKKSHAELHLRWQQRDLGRKHRLGHQCDLG